MARFTYSNIDSNSQLMTVLNFTKPSNSGYFETQYVYNVRKQEFESLTTIDCRDRTTGEWLSHLIPCKDYNFYTPCEPGVLYTVDIKGVNIKYLYFSTSREVYCIKGDMYALNELFTRKTYTYFRELNVEYIPVIYLRDSYFSTASFTIRCNYYSVLEDSLDFLKHLVTMTLNSDFTLDCNPLNKFLEKAGMFLDTHCKYLYTVELLPSGKKLITDKYPYDKTVSLNSNLSGKGRYKFESRKYSLHLTTAYRYYEAISYADDSRKIHILILDTKNKKLRYVIDTSVRDSNLLHINCNYLSSVMEATVKTVIYKRLADIVMRSKDTVLPNAEITLDKYLVGLLSTYVYNLDYENNDDDDDDDGDYGRDYRPLSDIGYDLEEEFADFVWDKPSTAFTVTDKIKYYLDMCHEGFCEVAYKLFKEEDNYVVSGKKAKRMLESSDNKYYLNNLYVLLMSENNPKLYEVIKNFAPKYMQTWYGLQDCKKTIDWFKETYEDVAKVDIHGDTQVTTMYSQYSIQEMDKLSPLDHLTYR